jgi:valine--pyruvate aminotransferase
MSSGAPPVFPEVAAVIKEELTALSHSKQATELLCQYGAVFADGDLQAQLCRRLGDVAPDLGAGNLLVTPGAMAAIFYASQVFAGKNRGQLKKILTPQAPEFPDYFSMGLPIECYKVPTPRVATTGEHSFRYELDIDGVSFDDVGMVLLSRPANPSGMVISDESLRALVSEAKAHDAVVVVDGAYGGPFPELLFNGHSAAPVIDDNVIHVMSFSKAGLAGCRVGLAIGPNEYINYLKTFQLNFCLTAPNLGQVLAARLLESGQLDRLTQSVIKPFYRERIEMVHGLIAEHCDPEIPYFLHELDGGMFVWLWLQDLPVDSADLCRRLHERGVFLAPGEMFFNGISDPGWSHQRECVRLSLVSPEDELRTGVQILCEILTELYRAR